MKTIFVIAAALMLCSGCFLSKSNIVSATKEKSTQKKMPRIRDKSFSKEVFESWYPVSFNKYDQNEVDSIISLIKSKRVRRITITYDNNIKLAEQIKTGIQQELNFAVTIKQIKPKDTKSTKSDHDKVLVTVYQ